jgi:hypothetical protein
MNMKYFTIVVILAALLIAAALSGSALAQTGGGYDLSWHVIAGGGYTLQGAIGQAAAGTLAGGGYTLRGGFWSGPAAASSEHAYLPLLLKVH